MIDKNLYVNSLEYGLLKEMKESAYFTKEVLEYYRKYDEKLRKPDLLGKTIKVTKTQFKNIYELSVEIAKLLDVDIPNIYIYEDFYYGLESYGINETWIEISAKTVMDFSIDEIKFLLAREMCNIKLKHTYYKTLINETLKAMENHNLNIGLESISKTFKVVAYKWNRIANYTADCFGYIACKDIKTSVRVIIKLVLNNTFLAKNVDINEYIKQTEDINKLDDKVYNFTKMDEIIPYGPFRIKNLIAYASSNRAIKAIKLREIS